MSRWSKLIFLDVDGVLNCASTRTPFVDADGIETGMIGIERQFVDRVNAITDATGASIVVSSTWRFFDGIYMILRHAGITGHVVGMTPRTSSGIRGHEIQQFLDEGHEQPTVFVILDDSRDMAHLMPHLVNTSWQTGLQDEHVQDAIQRLGRLM